MRKQKTKSNSKRRMTWIEGKAFYNQPRRRMRVHDNIYQAALQLHVIDAIRRSCRVDEEGLFDVCVEEVQSDGVIAGEFRLLVKLIDMTIDDKQPEKAAVILKANLRRIKEHWRREDTCHSLELFDDRYLNGSGVLALGAAITYELLDLDPAEVDEAVMGETLKAAYGRRKTQEHKRKGKELQKKLKQLLSLHEPAIRGAADRYVRFQYLFDGELERFMTSEELETEDEDELRSERYYRGWFGKFNRAYGFEPQWK